MAFNRLYRYLSGTDFRLFYCQSPEGELFRSYYRAAAPDEECELIPLPELFCRLICFNASVMRGASPEINTRWWRFHPQSSS